jgi:hypothetical protein
MPDTGVCIPNPKARENSEHVVLGRGDIVIPDASVCISKP